MKLRTRILMLVIAAMLGLASLSLVALYELKSMMMDERRKELSDIAELAHASLTKIHEREKAGEFNREDAQKLARQTLGSFHKDDRYIFARGFSDDVIQIHPNPKRVGFVDKDGKAKGDQYRAALSGVRIGYLMGEGTRPGVTEKVPKLYAVIKFEPWDWMVGYADYVDDINTLFWQNISLFLTICSSVIAVVGILAFRLSRVILGQLGGEPAYASRLAEAVAAGDLTGEIEVRGADSSLLGSMRSMQDGLRQMVGRFRSASEQLAASSGSLKQHMDRVRLGTRQTTEATNSTAAAIQEMSASVENISESAHQTEGNSQSAVTLACHGEQLAVDAASEIRRISVNMDAATSVVQNLVQRSHEINSMSGVIRDIADQTNLLALNAAIEAARAGEQGRGFAVVADEVRKLAERTAAATQDITNTIHAIQGDTGTAASHMEAVRHQVLVGVDLAEKAAGALREISAGATTTLDKTRDVAHAAGEQSETSASIAQNVERISEMVESSEAAVEAAFEQVRQLDELARDLYQAAARFKL
ncbi:methyl-accepting chemotaxis protein [Dechloromonas sp. ARDL1]|uniref:methyl-accepting chemotaxis protein n=1 Tax=Dechloromonas sp. ARDL1 TaxID=3322121 RepID=UPI003DA71119